MDPLEVRLVSTILLRRSCAYLTILKGMFLYANNCSYIDLNFIEDTFKNRLNYIFRLHLTRNSYIK